MNTEFSKCCLEISRHYSFVRQVEVQNSKFKQTIHFDLSTFFTISITIQYQRTPSHGRRTLLSAVTAVRRVLAVTWKLVSTNPDETVLVIVVIAPLSGMKASSSIKNTDQLSKWFYEAAYAQQPRLLHASNVLAADANFSRTTTLESLTFLHTFWIFFF